MRMSGDENQFSMYQVQDGLLKGRAHRTDAATVPLHTACSLSLPHSVSGLFAAAVRRVVGLVAGAAARMTYRCIGGLTP